MTISWAKEIAGWTGRIDDDQLQAEADKILVEAAIAGADLDDLKLIAQAAYEAWREREPDPEQDPRGRGFGERYLDLETTMDGAGGIRGDLTPECAAALTAVLEALGKRRGPEDLRTAGQRCHDALQEGCELLIRAKMVPDWSGADTRVDVIIPLSDLLAMDGASVIEDTWLRARAGQHGYLSGTDAEAVACDAMIVPVVAGSPDWAIIAQMTALVADALAHAADSWIGRHPGQRAPRQPIPPLPPEDWEDLQQGLARLAIGFVSGPGAIASALKARPPGRPAERQERPPGHRLLRHHPLGYPQGRHHARQGLRLARLQPPPRRLRRPPRQTQKARRQNQHPRLRSCSASTTTTSASTATAGTSNYSPTHPPASPAPTNRPSSAASAAPTPARRIALSDDLTLL